MTADMQPGTAPGGRMSAYPTAQQAREQALRVVMNGQSWGSVRRAIERAQEAAKRDLLLEIYNQTEIAIAARDRLTATERRLDALAEEG